MNKRFRLSDRFSVETYGVDELQTLQEMWDRCAANNGSYLPFLCFDWFEIWLRHFPETKLHVAVLFEHGDVAAIMPMMRKTVNKKGLSFEGVAFAGNAYSQARAILHNTIDPDARVEQAEWLLRYFKHHAPRWDLLDMYGLQSENGNCDQIVHAASRIGLRCCKTTAYVNCFQDNFVLSAEEYLATRPTRVRKNAPYYRRKMQREGDLQFRLITTAEGLDPIMDSYYRLYAKSWKCSEDLGPNFHRDLVKMAAKNGWLRLGFLDFNSSPIACQLWLVQGGTAYIVKVFYDEGNKRYSPGTVLSDFMIKTILNQDNISCIDYLQGEEGYKKDFVDNERKRYQILLFNNNAKGILLSLYYKIKLYLIKI
jgi:CelD/BcsL family acetyltransferase involved in cellulose biosynthesis